MNTPPTRTLPGQSPPFRLGTCRSRIVLWTYAVFGACIGITAVYGFLIELLSGDYCYVDLGIVWFQWC